MAEFCKQCAEELGFESDFTDLFKAANIEPGGDIGFPMLCETCGPCCFIIDNEGTCGSNSCDGSLNPRDSYKPIAHGFDKEYLTGDESKVRSTKHFIHERREKLC